jgi:hypothetical protein
MRDTGWRADVQSRCCYAQISRRIELAQALNDGGAAFVVAEQIERR